MDKRLMLWTVVLIVVNLTALLIVLPMMNNRDEVEPANDSVASMNILLNGVSLENVKNWSKFETYEGNKVELRDGAAELELNNVSIGGRGNSTWYQEKIPLRVKLGKRENLLGLGNNKKWNLLANQFDDTHLRNEIAFEYWNMLGDDVQIREEPVSLYIDGVYEGLYYLIPKIEISKSLVDVRDNYGILVEFDNLNTEEEYCYRSKNNNCLVVEDMVDWNNESYAMEVFMDKFNRLEEAAENGDWNSLQELCDLDSFARYFLVSEFSSNPDAYSSSFFFSLDGGNSNVHVGPAWDFDYAFDNQRWSRGDSSNRALVNKDRAFGTDLVNEFGNVESKGEPNLNISRIFFWMMDIPEFRERVELMVQERLVGNREELIKDIKIRRDQIRDEAIRNNEKWDRMNFDEEAEKLIDWISRRYSFIEEEYGSYGDTGFEIKQI